MKKLLLIIFITALVLIGCTPSTPNPTPEPKPDPDAVEKEYNVADYFPFLENTLLSYAGEGNEYAEKDVFFEFAQGKYLQVRNSNPGTKLAQLYEVTEKEVKLISSFEEVYFSYNFINEGELDSNGEVLLKSPIAEGNKWNLSDGREREITGVDVNVDTLYQSFEDAIEVTTINDDGSSQTSYYVAGLGLVKSVYKTGESEIITSLEKILQDTSIEESILIHYPDFINERIVYVEEILQLKSNTDIKKISAEYLRNSPGENIRNVMGENAEINEIIYNREQQEVTVDFNREFITEMQAGVFLESQILTSVANTFGGYYQVEKVFITIEGKPYESGHILFKEGEFLSPKIEEAIPFKEE